MIRVYALDMLLSCTCTWDTTVPDEGAGFTRSCLLLAGVLGR